MGRSALPQLLTPPQPCPRRATFPSPPPPPKPPPPQPPPGPTPSAASSAPPGARRGCRACTARVLCQPRGGGGGLRGVYGLESHMAPGPARAPPLPRAPFSRAAPGARSRSPPRRATCRLPLGPIAHAAATPTGSQARAPIGRIRTLALPLHPAVDPAPPPPSAAAPRPAQARLPASSNCVRFWRQTASGSGSPRPAPLGPRPAPRASRWLHLLGQRRRRRRRKGRGRLPGAWAAALQAAAPFWVCQTLTDSFCRLSGKVTAALPMFAPAVAVESLGGVERRSGATSAQSLPLLKTRWLPGKKKKQPAKAVVVARILCSYSKLDADCVPGTVLTVLHEFLLRAYE